MIPSRSLLSVIAPLVALPALADVTGPNSGPRYLGMRRPNELGRIPIVMYHSIGERGRFDRNGLNIRPATFRKHLGMMRKAGWYPVNVRDLFVPGALGLVPKGLTPVAITFDDARGSQFRYLKNGKIDPNCAIGILEAFHAKYGAKWPQRATFYVLPQSSYNPTPFWQRGLDKKKFAFLVEAGYEIGNHSTTHHAMRHMTAAQLAWEMASCTAYVRKLCPEATMDTMCLPYGVAPANRALWPTLLSNGKEDSPYRNHCIVLAWGDESYAPLDRRFDPLAIPRLGVNPGYFERAFQRLNQSGALYVSDGQPAVVSVPRRKEKFVAAERLAGARLIVYDTPPPGTHATVVQAPRPVPTASPQP